MASDPPTSDDREVTYIEFDDLEIEVSVWKGMAGWNANAVIDGRDYRAMGGATRDDALTRLKSSISFSTEATFALGVKNRRYWSPESVLERALARRRILAGRLPGRPKSRSGRRFYRTDQGQISAHFLVLLRYNCEPNDGAPMRAGWRAPPTPSDFTAGVRDRHEGACPACLKT